MVTAPEELRVKLRGLRTPERVAICAKLRPGSSLEPNEATKIAMRCLARRHQELGAEIEGLDAAIAPLCQAANPALLSATGVGPEVASALLVAAGDNPDRMHSEGSFAALCGSSPVEASSGKVTRHRLNRGGNREANNALWRIVMVRLTCDRRTQLYAERRRTEGKSDREILRCLKRYVAREVYYLLVSPPLVTDVGQLRERRLAAGVTLATVAAQLGTWPIRVSELERGITHSEELAHRYQDWLDNRAQLIA